MACAAVISLLEPCQSRQGHWLLLDEINLASAETLQRLAGLLEGGSVTLAEKGEADAVPRHEAQLLPPRALEQIRLLSNLETPTQKLLQIILMGQPELKDIYYLQ